MNIEEAPRSLREKQRLERQELILQAAEQVFVEKGYHETSMDEIAARVGIGTATIYLHFSSKEDLMLAAIMERDFKKVSRKVGEIAQGSASATEKLTSVFHYLTLSDFFRRRVQIAYAVGNTPEAMQVWDARQERMAGCAHILNDSLIAIIQQGKEAGEFRPEISTEAMVKTFLALMRFYGAPDRLLVDHAISEEEFILIYFKGITNNAG